MNRSLQDGLLNGRVAAAVFACLAGLSASATATPAGQALDSPFPRLDRHAAGLLAKDIPVATLDGRNAGPTTKCRFNGCTTRTRIAGLCLGALPPVIDSSISRHTSSTLSKTTADQILESATETLQTNNVGGDEVPLRHLRAQRLGDHASRPATGSIDEPGDYNAVLALPEQGQGRESDQLVPRHPLRVCPRLRTQARQLAGRGHHRLNHKDGIVWTHEYGHTQGVAHRTAYNTRFVMNHCNRRQEHTCQHCRMRRHPLTTFKGTIMKPVLAALYSIALAIMASPAFAQTADIEGFVERPTPKECRTKKPSGSTPRRPRPRCWRCSPIRMRSRIGTTSSSPWAWWKSRGLSSP